MMWFTIIGMACITFLNRFAFLSASFRYMPGEKLSRFLSFSSLAVLTAIWMPMVISLNPEAGASLASLNIAGWDYVLGTLVAGGLTLLRVPSLIVVVVSTAIFFGSRFLIF